MLSAAAARLPWLSSTSAWALKRISLFVIKRLLRRILLAVEIDKLDVQLTSGSLELRGVALNVDTINAHLVDGPFRLTAGQVGRFKVSLPWLSGAANCNVELEAPHLVLVPVACDFPAQETDTAQDEGDGGPPSTVRATAVRAVAAAAEYLLQGLAVSVRDASVLLLPAPDAAQPHVMSTVALLRCEELRFQVESSESVAKASADPFLPAPLQLMARRVQLGGVQLAIGPAAALSSAGQSERDASLAPQDGAHLAPGWTRVLGGEDGACGCHGLISLRMAMLQGGASSVDIDVKLGPIALSTTAMALELATGVLASLSSPTAVQSARSIGGNLHRSLFDELLPDDGVPAAGAAASSAEDEEFFDCCESVVLSEGGASLSSSLFPTGEGGGDQWASCWAATAPLAAQQFLPQAAAGAADAPALGKERSVPTLSPGREPPAVTLRVRTDGLVVRADASDGSDDDGASLLAASISNIELDASSRLGDRRLRFAFGTLDACTGGSLGSMSAAARLAAADARWGALPRVRGLRGRLGAELLEVCGVHPARPLLTLGDEGLEGMEAVLEQNDGAAGPCSLLLRIAPAAFFADAASLATLSRGLGAHLKVAELCTAAVQQQPVKVRSATSALAFSAALPHVRLVCCQAGDVDCWAFAVDVSGIKAAADADAKQTLQAADAHLESLTAAWLGDSLNVAESAAFSLCESSIAWRSGQHGGHGFFTAAAAAALREEALQRGGADGASCRPSPLHDGLASSADVTVRCSANNLIMNAPAMAALLSRGSIMLAQLYRPSPTPSPPAPAAMRRRLFLSAYCGVVEVDLAEVQAPSECANGGTRARATRAIVAVASAPCMDTVGGGTATYVYLGVLAAEIGRDGGVAATRQPFMQLGAAAKAGEDTRASAWGVTGTRSGPNAPLSPVGPTPIEHTSSSLRLVAWLQPARGDSPGSAELAVRCGALTSHTGGDNLGCNSDVRATAEKFRVRMCDEQAGLGHSHAPERLIEVDFELEDGLLVHDGGGEPLIRCGVSAALSASRVRVTARVAPQGGSSCAALAQNVELALRPDRRAHVQPAPGGAPSLAQLHQGGFARVARERSLEASVSWLAAAPGGLSCRNSELRLDLRSDSLAALLQLFNDLLPQQPQPQVGVVALLHQPSEGPGSASGSQAVLAAVAQDAFSPQQLPARPRALSRGGSGGARRAEGPPAAVLIENYHPRPERLDDESEGPYDGWLGEREWPPPPPPLSRGPLAGVPTGPLRDASTGAGQRPESAGSGGRGDVHARWLRSPPHVRDTHVPQQPPPEPLRTALWRAVLQDASIVITLHAGACWPVASPGAPASESTVTGIELRLAGLTASFEALDAAGPEAWRLRLRIEDVRVLDNTIGAPWRCVLCADEEAQRETGSPVVAVAVTAVRPSPAAAPHLVELRCRCAVIPIRILLDQRVAFFAAVFFTGSAPESTAECGPTVSPPEEAFFQIFEVAPMRLRVDYRPLVMDSAALLSGSLAEVLNLVPWGGVRLRLARVRLVGVSGVGCAAGDVAGAWLTDVASTQAHKFVSGMRTIRPLVSIGRGAAQLVRAPVEEARQRRVLRGVRAGVVAFVSAVGAEARTLRSAAAGTGRHILRAAAWQLEAGGDITSSRPPPAGAAAPQQPFWPQSM